MDAFVARAVGELCAATGASDVVDGHVAWRAYNRDLTVVTSDPDDISVFGLGLRIVVI